ncbi:MAG: hypothetical protein M3349_07810 [Actinomycetota bacterium]|nr:hypothetical protein [Actinomycetota bacterium]
MDNPEPPPLELNVVVPPVDRRPAALPEVGRGIDTVTIVAVAAAVVALVFATLTWVLVW